MHTTASHPSDWHRPSSDVGEAERQRWKKIIKKTRKDIQEPTAPAPNVPINGRKIVRCGAKMSGTRLKLRYYREPASGAWTRCGWWSRWTTSGDGELMGNGRVTRVEITGSPICARKVATNLSRPVISATTSLPPPSFFFPPPLPHCLISQTARDKMHTRGATYRHEYARKPSSNLNSGRDDVKSRKMHPPDLKYLFPSAPLRCSSGKIVFRRGDISVSELPIQIYRDVKLTGNVRFYIFSFLRDTHLSRACDENEGLILDVPMHAREWLHELGRYITLPVSFRLANKKSNNARQERKKKNNSRRRRPLIRARGLCDSYKWAVYTWLCVELLELNGAPFNATVRPLIATVHVTLTTHATSEGVTWAISRSARRAVERINEMDFTVRTHENAHKFTTRGDLFLLVFF